MCISVRHVKGEVIIDEGTSLVGESNRYEDEFPIFSLGFKPINAHVS